MLEIEKKISLKNWTSWRAGGEADFLARPKSLTELKEAVLWAHEKNQPIGLLGAGTNVLISDRGVRGLVIILKELNSFSVKKENNKLFVSALCGCPKYQLMRIFAKEKLAPALFLCGLPGDVGGGAAMNAGVGHEVTPREFKDITESIQVLPFDGGNLKLFKKDELHWAYRSCRGFGKGVIYSAEFSWPLEPIPDFQLKLKEMNQRRISTQPLSQLSCGSVFKNPPGERAGRLIEKAGLKGKAFGQAEVSSKHANFIINRGGAQAADIAKLISHIKNVVQEKFQIQLEPEVRCLGDWNV